MVYRAADLSVVCAVELNDRSHGTQRAKARDELLAGVCRVINLTLLQFTARKSYPVQELQAQFQAAMGTAQENRPPVSAKPPGTAAKRLTAER